MNKIWDYLNFTVNIISIIKLSSKADDTPSPPLEGQIGLT